MQVQFVHSEVHQMINTSNHSELSIFILDANNWRILTGYSVSAKKPNLNVLSTRRGAAETGLCPNLVTIVLT
jgi:hypothetical protein